MRKYAILAVLMALVIAVTSSCGLIVKDPVVDAKTVIIEVVGEQIVKEDVQQAIQNVLDYQEYVYSMYGISYDRTDEDTMAAAQDTAIDAMIEEAVTNEKIREYGLDQFTDEELAAMTESANETYAGYIDSVTTYYFADTELTGEELDAAIEAKILEVGYGSIEDLLEQEKQTEALTKLRDMVVKDVAITEDEIQTQYNNGIADALTAYASDLTKYASDVKSGAIIYVVPDGYRYVKNLLVMINDDERTKISTLTSQLADDEDSLSAIEEALAQLDEDTEEDTGEDAETKQKTREELTAQVEELTAAIQSETDELNELTTAAYAAIQPTVNMLVSKIEAGEDFDALIEEYGEDTGMKAEPAKSTGYLVCEGLTTYVDEFVQASMALENVGDISDPFLTSYGIHIVQYASDVETGEVALDDIRESIAEDLLADKQDAVYTETVSQWVTEANAKVYTDRLAD